jgi:hypothetical protein
MGKAIDTLHDGMVEIEKNGKTFLDKGFMNNLFSKIHVNEVEELGPLEPLVKYMKYYLCKWYLFFHFFFLLASEILIASSSIVHH